jgi:hypothetical protein
MNIFLSWSGERSKAVAAALHEWLPNVIHYVQPWMSSSDIYKGGRWGVEVARILNESSFGIICLTPENLNAPWILFEAGALSKTLEKTYVCPYLYEVSPEEIDGPLSQFQATRADKDDTFNLVRTINEALGEQALRQHILESSFKLRWTHLNRMLKKVKPLNLEAAGPRRDSEIMPGTYDTVKILGRT